MRSSETAGIRVYVFLFICGELLFSILVVRFPFFLVSGVNFEVKFWLILLLGGAFVGILGLGVC